MGITIETLGIVGFGNMAESLWKGMRKTKPLPKLAILEKVSARLDVGVRKYGALDMQGKEAEFFRMCDVVVLAIKPQDLSAFLMAHGKALEGKRIFSILAGTPLSRFEGIPGLQTARCMPNLAASVGKAVSGLCFSENAGEAFRGQARLLAEAMGTCIEIPESKMAAVTAVSGSGIALAFQFIHAMALGTVRTGLGYDQAYAASLDMIAGAVEVLKKEGIHPSQMVSKVCSPSGTTIEGIKVLEDRGFNGTVMEALSAIADRVRELEG